jgi:uncharacterized membrane-anchored protein
MKFVAVVLIQTLLLSGIVIARQHMVDTGVRVVLKTEPVDPRSLFQGDYVRLAYDISTLDIDALSVKDDFARNQKIYVTLQPDHDKTMPEAARPPNQIVISPAYRPVSVSKTPPAEKLFIRGTVVQYLGAAQRYEVAIKDNDGLVHNLRPRWFYDGKAGDFMTFCLNKNGAVVNFVKSEHIQPKGKPCYFGDPLAGTILDVRVEKFRQVTVEYGIESYFVEEGRGRAVEATRNVGDLRVEVAIAKSGQALITALLLDGKALR